MNAVPSISVVVPLYNKSAYVGDALRSVLAQTQPAAEIIVVDDGSTDGSANIVRRIASPTIHLVTQPNAGVSAARNAGIERASGDYIAFLDADDCYAPIYLSAVMRLIQRFPRAVMHCTGYARVWSNGRRTPCVLNRARPGTAQTVEDFYAAWCAGPFACTDSIVLRRSIFSDASMRFPVGERLGEDQDLWFRIAERGEVAYLNDALVDYRVDVLDSATQATVLRDVLPCYRRLGERLANREVPSRLQRSARRLLASHVLNVARARMRVGDVTGAWKLITDARAAAHPIYRARTVLRLMAGLRGAG